MSEKMIEKKFVYTGDWDGKSVKTVYGFLEIDEHGMVIDQNSEIFFKKKPRYCKRPGTIVGILHDLKEDSFRLPTDANIYGFCDNESMQSQIMDWQIRSKARYEQRQNIKGADRDLVVEQLDEIKQVYWDLSPARRKALLAYILHYIMS